MVPSCNMQTQIWNICLDLKFIPYKSLSHSSEYKFFGILDFNLSFALVLPLVYY